MQKIPQELKYNKLWPKGFLPQFKEWIVDPQNTSPFYPGQQIKFQLQTSQDGVIDVFRSHFQIQVGCVPQTTTTQQIGGLQVDSSAQSFIQQLVISSRNRQIQRIGQYSSLAAVLTDIGVLDTTSLGRQDQGLGSGYPVSQSYGNLCPTGTTTSSYSGQADVYPPNGIYVGTSGIIPTISGAHYPANGDIVGDGSISLPLASRMAKTHVGFQNPCWMEGTQDPSSGPGQTMMDTSVAMYGSALHIRGQYLLPMSQNNFVDSTTSMNCAQVNLNSKCFNNTYPAKWPGNAPYQTQLQATITSRSIINSDLVQSTFPNSTNLLGFSNLFSPEFSNGLNQPMISTSIPQCQMQNGLILQQKVPVSIAVFKIPIISSVIGILIPPDQFVMLPLRCLNEMTIDVLLDKYAMFSTGYSDFCQFDNIGMGVPIPRNFIIRNMVYKVHTYQYDQADMQEYIRASLTRNVYITSTIWIAANQYQIANGQNVANAWKITSSSQVLNSVLVFFEANDYLKYPFCRKHFRLSNCISKMSIRNGLNYYPPQPLQGNAGNPSIVDSTGSNSQFFQKIQEYRNMFLSPAKIPCRINKKNFSINERCYNVTNNNTYYDPGMINSQTYQWSVASVNADTAMGMPWIHQNRFCGRAIFMYNFNPTFYSKRAMIGLDVTKVNNFELLLTTNNAAPFPRQQTMYIFTKSTCVVKYTPQGVSLIGIS